MRSLSPFYRGSRFPTGWDNFEDIFNDFEKAFYPTQKARDFHPALDIEEREGIYLVSMDIPGMKKEDLKINLSDRTLTVSGERNQENKGQGHYYERSYGRFARSITLPENVQSEAIEAHYEDGVLKLVIPKAEEAKAKAIKVQDGKPGGLLEKFFNKKTETKDAETPSNH